MDENLEFSSTSQDSKAEYILSNVAEVVERILTFVPTKSLLRIACVCRLWRNCARRVLRTQQKFTWVSASGTHSCDAVLCNTLADKLENIFLLPQTVLLMVDSESFNDQGVSCRQKRARKSSQSDESDTAEGLRRLFPTGCDIVGVACPGIVLTPSGEPSALPQEHQEGEAGFCLMFPRLEGVTIRPFHFCKQSLTREALEEAGLMGNPELRVVLLFSYELHRSGAQRFFNRVLKPLTHSNVLIAGGHVEDVFSGSRDCCARGAYGVAGLALSGPRVQGASVLLEREMNSPQAAEAAVRRLKAANIPERNALGFMFACVGRGHVHYGGRHGVEAAAFRKAFPGVPLLGFFGNGEIGCDRIVTGNYSLTDADAYGLQHSFTTVMTLVHLG